jgi:hypothetical protein
MNQHQPLGDESRGGARARIAAADSAASTALVAVALRDDTKCLELGRGAEGVPYPLSGAVGYL